MQTVVREASLQFGGGVLQRDHTPILAGHNLLSSMKRASTQRNVSLDSKSVCICYYRASERIGRVFLYRVSSAASYRMEAALGRHLRLHPQLFARSELFVFHSVVHLKF